MILAFSIADLIRVPFGYLMDFLYQFTSNYGMALILFALLVKLILLPASAKSKKSMMKMSRFAPLRWLTRTVVWVIRGTPLILQLYIIFYVPGMVMDRSPWPGGESGRFVASAVAFIINYACYFSEIYRGGIQGVPRGQQEAGLVLGMTKRQIFFKVTLLQMIKRIVPPMSNEIITLVKDTSIARIVSLQEVIWAGYAFMKSSHGYSGLIWPLFFTGVYFLVFNGLLTILFNRIEKKLDYFQ